MRLTELMLVIRPDVPDDKSQAVIDRVTRQITAGGGQIIKVAPWGRRLAYPIDRFREGSYHIVLFAGPGGLLTELEHSLLITEEVIRHLITRDERPAKPAARMATLTRPRTARTSTPPDCPRTCTRTRTTAPSGSAKTRARRPRPPSTEGATTMALCKVMIIGNLGPIPRCATRRPTAR